MRGGGDEGERRDLNQHASGKVLQVVRGKKKRMLQQVLILIQILVLHQKQDELKDCWETFPHTVILSNDSKCQSMNKRYMQKVER